MARRSGPRRARGVSRIAAALAALTVSCAAVAAEPRCDARPTAPDEPSLPVVQRAIQWAEAQASAALQAGDPLTPGLAAIAKGSGVKLTRNIRLVVVDEIPLPEDPPLAGAAAKLGISSSGAAGLTLGYAVLVARGYEADQRLLSHEFRHVAQYEACGGIAPFLAVHLRDMLEHGYENSPFEVDARAHERP
jgi:hypothetical protein